MSAILGILKYHGQTVDQCDLQKMAQVMSHRGPDDQGFWSQGPTGLGHRMFRTTPESLHEKQPVQDSESGFVITADARIDNRDELAKSLGLSHAIKEGLPDSYFILSAYKKWGKQCVNHLLGDFSFAIWSPRDNCLFCARDHMGVKPFNYYADQNTFIFATEVQAILEVPSVPKKINEGRIADFLVSELEGIDKTSTFFEQIYRLPPAHTIWIENGSVTLQCYWMPDSEKRIVLASDEDYEAAFTEIYTDAIEKRMRGNENVASMLSGGMDSSSIVGIARDLHLSKTGQPFPVFSAISPTDKQACRETYFINSVLNQGGLLPQTISIDELDDFNEDISKVMCAAQEPFDPMIMIIAIYLLAKKSGYRVMLDGIDGDVIASLSPSYPAIFLKDGCYYEALNSMFMQKKNFYAGRLSTSKILYQNLRATYTPEILRKFRRTWRKHVPAKLPNDSLINKEFAKEIHLTDRLTQLHAHSGNSLSKSTHTLHAKSILHPYLSVGLERYDRVAALCGIEPRHPLLDRRIVDFMVSIPPEQKVRHGWNKYLLRRTSESFLNKEVCWRRGQENIGWNFEQKWLQENLSHILNTIDNNPESMGKYLAYSKLNEIMSLFKSSTYKTYDRTEEIIILELFQISNWLANH